MYCVQCIRVAERERERERRSETFDESDILEEVEEAVVVIGGQSLCLQHADITSG